VSRDQSPSDEGCQPGKPLTVVLASGPELSSVPAFVFIDGEVTKRAILARGIDARFSGATSATSRGAGDCVPRLDTTFSTFSSRLGSARPAVRTLAHELERVTCIPSSRAPMPRNARIAQRRSSKRLASAMHTRCRPRTQSATYGSRWIVGATDARPAPKRHLHRFRSESRDMGSPMCVPPRSS
jgi:hypothetical protein